MTMTFVSLVLIQFFKAYGYRSDHQHVLHRPLANRWLNSAILWELGLLFLIMYVPFLQRAFGLTPLNLGVGLPRLLVAYHFARSGIWEMAGAARRV
jgi:Ca2+-transporting ATPase